MPKLQVLLTRVLFRQDLELLESNYYVDRVSIRTQILSKSQAKTSWLTESRVMIIKLMLHQHSTEKYKISSKLGSFPLPTNKSHLAAPSRGVEYFEKINLLEDVPLQKLRLSNYKPEELISL